MKEIFVVPAEILEISQGSSLSLISRFSNSSPKVMVTCFTKKEGKWAQGVG